MGTRTAPAWQIYIERTALPANPTRHPARAAACGARPPRFMGKGIETVATALGQLPEPVQDVLLCAVGVGAVNHSVGPFTLATQLVLMMAAAAGLQFFRAVQSQGAVAAALKKPMHQD